MIQLGIIIANIIYSMVGFKNRVFFEKNLFHIDPILKGKEYARLISSAFLHADYIHLFLNMYVFWNFVGTLSPYFSDYGLLNVYVGSLLAGNVLALFLHRNDGSYRAVGASGAVSGIVFASIVLMPQLKLTLIILPFTSFPAWVFGILYILYSLFGIRNRSGNIGHEAHLGGAMGGLIIALLYYPNLLEENLYIILGMVVPTIVFLYLMVKHPLLLQKRNFSFKREEKSGYPEEKGKAWHEAKLNQILEKIQTRGMDSLDEEEKRFLDTYR